MEEDSLLVKRFKNKDRAAFDEIFAKYHKPIYYFICKMVLNAETAEDITQDTFVKVYKNLERTDEHIKLAPWIYKIAHNTFIDYTRKNKVIPEPLDPMGYQSQLTDGSSAVNPETSYMNSELRNKINKTMQKLSSRYKTVLILRDYNDFSYKEISLILDLSEAAVKSLIHRARLEFQKTFKEL